MQHINNREQNIEQHTEQNTENNTERTQNSTQDNAQPQRTCSAHNYRTYSLDYYQEYAYIKNNDTIELYTILQEKI